MRRNSVAVIGGCGHVGLPLAVLNASKGRPTYAYDIDATAVREVREARAPFLEEGLPELLEKVLRDRMLEVSTDPAGIAEAEFVALVVGTPVDEYLNPRVRTVFEAVEGCLPHLREGQILILRSTVYPGVSARLQEFLRDRGVEVAFCPERVAQGRAIHEMQRLPQIVSGFSRRGIEAARRFFAPIAPETIVLDPLEAELAKLFTNAYRYIEFAIVNQFYMIAEQHGADFHRIRAAIMKDYPRLAHLPRPGFAAGPCLLKDTMQLAAFHHHNFSLGLAALWVNEGLPDFVVERVKAQGPLRDKTVGILGMAFKAGNDDRRDSLSYKLRKLLRLEAKRVLCHDPHVRDPDLLPLEQVIRESDVLIIATPHREYRTAGIPEGKRVVDVWNCRNEP